MPRVEDVSVEEFEAGGGDHYAIRYRIGARDIGYDLRSAGEALAVQRRDDPLIVSYRGDGGDLRVLQGPQAAVLRRLRSQGYQFHVVDCFHENSRNLYDQRPPSEGRKLKAAGRLCEDCGAVFSKDSN